jgi:hypothetical protein
VAIEHGQNEGLILARRRRGFRATVAAEAVRALVVAGLLTEADATAAIDILVDAELITEEVAVDAATIAEAAIAEIDQDW